MDPNRNSVVGAFCATRIAVGLCELRARTVGAVGSPSHPGQIVQLIKADGKPKIGGSLLNWIAFVVVRGKSVAGPRDDGNW